MPEPRLCPVGHEGVEPVVLVQADGEYLEFERVGLSEEHGTIYFKEGDPNRKKLRWGQKTRVYT